MKKTLIYAGSLLLAAAIVAGGVHAKNRNTDISRNILIFNDVYKTLMNNYVDTLDATETMRTAIDAMLGNVDPYTEFYSEEESDKLTSISSGEYAGIGSVIQKQDTVIVLSEPRWDSPAMRGGFTRSRRIRRSFTSTTVRRRRPSGRSARTAAATRARGARTG